jgi:recombination protein RecT
MSNELSTLPSGHFDNRLDELAKVMPCPDKEKASHFARMVLTALNKNPELLRTTPESRLACLFDIVAVGLEPNTPHGYAYLIPYGNQCTLQIGYKGFCKLAYDTNQVKIIKAGVVREGDQFDYAKGTQECFVKHTERLGRGRESRPLLGAWASIELINGGVGVEVMDADTLDKIMKLSRSPASKTWADEFRKKSVVKRMLKLLQLSGMTTVHRAIEVDNKGLTPMLPEKKAHSLTFGEDEPKQLQESSEPTEPAETRNEKGEFVWE